MAKQKRSKFYDDFRTSDNKSKNTNNNASKSVWLKVWKWIRILLIVFFVAVGLVGCVQSFTTKTSSKVGAGYEFYASKKVIPSPNVEVLKYDNVTNTFNVTNTEKDIKNNPYVGLNNQNQDVLKALKEQDEKSGAVYAAQGGNSLAVQFKDSNEKEDIIHNNVDADGIKRYEYINLSDKFGTKKYIPTQDFLSWTALDITVHSVKIGTDNRNLPEKLSKYSELYVTEKHLLSDAAINLFARDVLESLFKLTYKKWFDESINEGRGISRINELLYDAKFANAIGKPTLPSNATFEQKLEYLGYLHNVFKEAKNDAKYVDAGYIFASHPFWNQNLAEFGNKKYGELSNEDKLKAIQKWELYEWVQKAQTFLIYEAAMFKTYLKMFNYKVSSKDVINLNGTKEINNYTQSNVSELGNYSYRKPVLSLLPNDANTPHYALTSWKDYWKRGPFFGLFIYPINWISTKIIVGLGTTGWSVILALVIVVIVTRLAAFFLSLKTSLSQGKMEELNQKKAKIEAKYADAAKNDKVAQQKKQMEISQLYKDEKMSPFSSIVSMFITLPILIVVFRIITASPEIKHTTWYGIQLAATSIRKIINKEFIYLPLVLVSMLVQGLAQYLPKILNRKKKSLRMDAYAKAANKKSNKMGNMLQIIFIGIGILFSAGLQIYWIISGIWTIIQTLAVHYFTKSKFYKEKVEPKLFKKTA